MRIAGGVGYEVGASVESQSYRSIVGVSKVENLMLRGSGYN